MGVNQNKTGRTADNNSCPCLERTSWTQAQAVTIFGRSEAVFHPSDLDGGDRGICSISVFLPGFFKKHCQTDFKLRGREEEASLRKNLSKVIHQEVDITDLIKTEKTCCFKQNQKRNRLRSGV